MNEIRLNELQPLGILKTYLNSAKTQQKHVSVIQIYSNVGPLNRVAVVSLPASLFVTNLLRDAISSLITDQWS